MRFRSIAVIFAFLLPTVLLAQAPVPEGNQPVTTIVKKTQLVYVPVVVDDKHGQHVGGLKKEQFDIEQDGKKQEITLFQEVTHLSAETKSQPTFPPGSGYVENYTPPDQEARKLMIVVLDTLNTPFLKQGEARQELIKFLAKSLQSDVPISLMVLNSRGLNQVHAFTSDTSVLIEALKKMQSRTALTELADTDLEASQHRSTYSSAAAEATALQGDIGIAQFERFAQMDAARTTIRALEQLAGAYQGITGRKSVVWATGGFPFLFNDPESFSGLGQDFIADYNRVFDVLNNANMSIYAVDINGLVAPSLSYGTTRKGAPYDLAQQKQDTMRAFSDATGGKAFLNDNDFSKAFARAEQDGSAYYVVGYYLKDNDKPGWHKLKVHVKADHADVRAREGFLVPSPKNETKESKLIQLGVATLSPADYTGVHFGLLLEKADIEPEPATSDPNIKTAAAPAKRLQHFHLSFPPGTLVIDSNQNNFVSLDVLAVAMTKGEKEMGERVSGIRAHLKPTSLESFRKSGLGFEEHIDLPPGEYDFRVAVRDNVSGNLGTVRTHVVVP